MTRAVALVAAVVLLAGCASARSPGSDAGQEAAPPAHQGKVIGGAGGALAGSAIGYSSAGVLCTIGGPLCAIVVVPAAIVGGIVGLAAGSVVDAVTARKVETPPPSGG